MPTIADVARAAGVSRTAVSFAFNDPGQLSAATLQRILEVAEQLGYYPNAAARTLTTKRIGVLGLLIPQRSATVFANPFFREFLCGIGEVCDELGYALLLVPPLNGSLRRAVNTAAVDGYIMLGLDAAHDEGRLLARRRVPLVVVDGDPLPGVSAVNVDDSGGAEAAAVYMLSQRHRQILILGVRPPDEQAVPGTAFSAVVRRRFEGYRRAFQRFGLDLGDEDVVLCESTFEGGRQALQTVWQSGRQPTGVLAMSDAIALGALQAARAAGVAVPGALEIIGFDDITLAAWTDPPLSTVRQPIVDKGRNAARLLIAGLAPARDVPPEQLVLPTQLVLRGSTRAPSWGLPLPAVPVPVESGIEVSHG